MNDDCMRSIPTPQKLIDAAKDEISKITDSEYDQVNGCSFVFNGEWYGFINSDRSAWVDHSSNCQLCKYTYRLVEFTPDIISVPTDDNITAIYNVVVIVKVAKLGGYQTGFSYDFSKPVLYEISQ